MSLRSTRIAFTALLALALSACAGASLHRYPHATTHVADPLSVGSVQANQVVVDQSMVEQEYGLPGGTLMRDGVLTALDDSQICVQVTVRDVSDTEQARTPLAGYRVFLRANQNVRDDGRFIETSQAMATLPGTRPRQIQTGMETYCGGTDRYGRCYSWQTRPTYTTVYDPTVYNVTTQTGTACFVNNGFITSETDEMEVYFVLPNRSAGVGFEWQFDVVE